MTPAAGKARPGNRNAYKAERWAEEDRGHSTACWIWLLKTGRWGYGQIMADGRVQQAHRYYWEQANGPVPEGMVLDHLCRVTGCVRPDHLEVVTPLENWRRGEAPSAINARKTHCIRGHEFTPENTYVDPLGYRTCRTCRNASQRRRRAIA